MRDELMRCVKCRWCDLRADLERGERFFCRKLEVQLKADAPRRLPCQFFEPFLPTGHWGP